MRFISYLIALLLLINSCQSPNRILEGMKFQGNKKKIFILVSEQISSFEVVKNSFMEEGKKEYQFLSLNLDGNYDDLEQLPAQIRKLKPDLILCIGSKSLESLAGKITEIPILFAMVLDYQRFHPEKYGNIAGVSLSIPPETVFYNFKNYFGEINQYGVLSSRDHISSLRENRERLKNVNIQLTIGETNSPDDVQNKYDAIKKSIQALWMVPDPKVISEESFLFLVDNTINDKKSFIVYSEQFVKAGALFSTSPNYSTIGSQLAIKSQQILEDRQKPVQVGISPIIGTFLTLNKTTMKKLGLNVRMDGIDQVFE
ncbi:MAG TPA: ABC transporter substrate binding protein [Leptospiraceae bacterium]|nr:ABC transporter substrate binding protein [Leptospiraceae bacterium]HMW06950.1 ABC transporter substrate binding protein [Leptospiraceae bacterium]HMX34889.1 ABC transporter substrate binding protein [Leptospiraceae bacterium]HMY30582.1 ABC transporter substrate binding protein [Leptospiraceae bacterium]HMZ65513.1 ABC transporter substrate binding protein [Leptospiraceae bacterium]